MARITVEDCLEKVKNRFELVHLASKRTKQILRGSHPLVESNNKAPVISLREIAQGRVRPIELETPSLEDQAEADVTS